jgi:hypothetical protein
MNTRSKTKVMAKAVAEPLAKAVAEFEVNIDFDDASKEWHKNKKSIGNSQYKYICQIQTNKKGQCNKVCHQGSDKCWIHRNK